MALIVFSLSWSGVAIGGEDLILGVQPYLSKEKLIHSFVPLAEYLGKKIDRTIRLGIAKNYKEHIERVGNDEYDIAFMGPAPYVKLTTEYGPKTTPLARFEIQGKPYFQGKIIIPKNSTLKELRDLKGKRFAFGDPESTMSHLVPHYMLIEAGVHVEDLAHFDFVGSHDDVVQRVLAGDYDAGAVQDQVFYELEPWGLRELATTPQISEHLFVASNKLDPETISKLRTALYELKDSEQGRQIMQGIKVTLTAMVPVQDSDYDNLRAIIHKMAEAGIE